MQLELAFTVTSQLSAKSGTVAVADVKDKSKIESGGSALGRRSL
jgi:hypothetical protein